MSISPTDLRPGSVFKDSKGNVLQVIESQHVKPGKGAAYYQVKSKNLLTGSIVEERLNSGSSYEDLFIEKTQLLYVNNEGDYASFYNSDYESVSFPLDELGTMGNVFKAVEELKEPVQLTIRIFKDDRTGKTHIIGLDLVNDIVLKVIDARPSIKGEAAKTGTKPAIVEGGINVRVPPHVNENDYVILSKADFGYVSRYK